ncbi:MAG: hypothetical protein JWM90_2467 [Thermoleophilia bacterium]|nr:hypothetical protein [Thermoleophilia bacterium]
MHPSSDARSHRSKRRRLVPALLLLACALPIAGCAEDSPAANSGPVKVRAVTDPATSTKLAEELGATATTLTDAGCVFGKYDEEEANHVDSDDQLKWKSFPPTSGNHFEAWAPWGEYEAEVPDGNTVHNLEHGGVVVWFGTKVQDETRSAVADLLKDGDKWLLAPRRDIEGLFSGAWGVGLSCPPEALTELGPDGTADVLDTWYDTVNSTGSEAEKDLPAYPGPMKEPTPKRDISVEAPF